MAFWLAPAEANKIRATKPLDTIVVTAKRRPDPVADEKMAVEVATALHTDPYFYDAHVTVTVTDGVVTLEGIVFDYWDMQTALRIGRKIAGVRRVINDLEIHASFAD
jgi:osmotically-inducible protein OsmY